MIQYFVNSNSLPNISSYYILTDSDSNFTSINQFKELIPTSAITNFSSINTIILSFNNNSLLNLFRIEFAYSYDNTTYTSYINYVSDATFSGIPKSETIYIKFKITLTSAVVNPIKLERVEILGFRDITESNTDSIFLYDNESILLRNSDIYKVFSITDYKLYSNIVNDSEINIKFRFSTDKKNWSEWVKLSKPNLIATNFNKLKFTYFEFLFKKADDNYSTITINDLELIGNFINVSDRYSKLGKFGLRNCCVECSDSQEPVKPFLPCEESESEIPTFNPYDYGNFIQVYNYLSNKANMIAGHEIDYYKSDVDNNGTDYLLHEFQLTNVSKVAKLKISVPENIFPDNQVKFSGFDLSLLDSFEVHIMREDFKKIFGIEERPAQNDIIFFCKLNRLFEVEHIIPDKTNFFVSSYYKVILKKYSADTTRNFSEDAELTISKLLNRDNSLDELFGANATKEQNDNSNLKQFNSLSRMILKRTIAPLTDIVLYNLVNSTLTIATHIYKVPLKNKNDYSVSYGNIDAIYNNTDNKSISFWFKSEQINNVDTYTFIDNLSSNGLTGYKLSYTNGVVTFIINNNTYTLSTTLSSNVWYAFVVNIAQMQEYIDISVYSRNVTNENDADKLDSSHLKLIKYNKFNISGTFEYNHTNGLKIGISISSVKNKYYYMTNIRLNKELITNDNVDIKLNETVVKDSNSLIMIDNCLNEIILPKYNL